MKATIEANLNDKAIENIIAAKNPEIVLLSCNWLYVLGSGLLTGVIVISLEPKWFM
jgi:hypothetical protein